MSVSAFFLAPLFLEKLGKDRYADLLILYAVLGAFPLFDLGLPTAVLKYVADSRFDARRVNAILHSAFLVLSLTAALVGLGLVVFADAILGSPDHSPSDELRTAFVIAVVVEVVLHPVRLVVVARNACLDYVSTSRIEVGVQLAIIAANLTILLEGPSLILVCVARAVAIGLGLGLNMGYLFRGPVKVWFLPFRPSWTETRSLLKFGLHIYSQTVGAFLHEHLTTFVVRYFFGSAYVVAHHFASILLNVVRSLAAAVTQPLLPLLSRPSGERDLGDIRECVRRAYRLIAVGGTLGTAGIVVLANSFLPLWLGGTQPLTELAVWLLAPGVLVSVMTTPSFFALNGIGRTDLVLKSSLLAIVVQIPAVLLGAAFFGFPGALFGTSLTMVVGAAYYLYQSSVTIRCPTLSDVGEGFALIIIAAGLAPFARLAASTLSGWAGLGLGVTTFVLSFFSVVFAATKARERFS